MFGFGKKKNTAPEEPKASNAPQGINLKKEKAVETLNLRKETLEGVVLTKGINNAKARVVLALDISGSTRSMFNNGTMQSVIEKVLPMAMLFDDDGMLDVFLFSNRSFQMPSITQEDFYGYVEREVLAVNKSGFWGGTEYAPVMEDILEQYTVKNPSDVPTFVIFITDGENSDASRTERVIRQASKHNVFWQFVGVGNEDFRFLKKLDDIDGRVIDNADFFSVVNIDRMTDEKIYNALLNEYPGWDKSFKQMRGVR